MKKSLIAGALIVAAASVLFLGCSKKSTAAASGNTEQKVVRINFSTGSLCHAPVHVAMKLGLFEEELAKIGQKAEYVQVVEGGATLGEMIASGKVDAGYGLYATQLQAMENGLPISFKVHNGTVGKTWNTNCFSTQICCRINVAVGTNIIFCTTNVDSRSKRNW